MKKKCWQCKKSKTVNSFYKNISRLDGLQTSCKPCNYKLKCNSSKTINGYLGHTYRNMRARVSGRAKSRAHIYKGLDILPKDQFINWSRNDPAFLKLHRNWVMNDYNHKLSPSINRIDPRKGYSLDNIEWITHSLNSSLSHITKYNSNKEISAIYRAVGVKHVK